MRLVGSMNILFKFSAGYCQPCKELQKVILATDIGDVDFREIDVGEEQWLTKFHGVRGIPTLILLDKEGNELKRHTGTMTSAALQNFVGYSVEEPLEEPWKATW